MSDLAFHCLLFHFGPHMTALKGVAGLDLKLLGIPVLSHHNALLKRVLTSFIDVQSEQEYLKVYLDKSLRVTV